MRVLAVDPGHTCGIAELKVSSTTVATTAEPLSVSPGHVYYLLTTRTLIDVVVAEEFRLYPWLATHQAYSELRTVEVIGVIKYLTAAASIPLYMQRADIKKEARHLAEQAGWEMQVRSLGSGKGKYRGPDFAVGGPQHGRDALAHGIWWAWRNAVSPAYTG